MDSECVQIANMRRFPLFSKERLGEVEISKLAISSNWPFIYEY